MLKVFALSQGLFGFTQEMVGLSLSPFGDHTTPRVFRGQDRVHFNSDAPTRSTELLSTHLQS